MSIQIRMRYFASLREVVGASEEYLSVPKQTTAAGARALLIERYPELDRVLTRALCAVNRQYVSPETALAEGDEVVFIPPVGGGSPEQTVRRS